MRQHYKTTYSMAADAWERSTHPNPLLSWPLSSLERHAQNHARILSWPEWWALRGAL